MNNSSNIKRYIKKPMVLLLVSLLLVISFPFSAFAYGELPVYDTRPLNSVVKQSPVYWLTDNQYNNRYYAGSTSYIDYCSYHTSGDGYFHVLMVSDSNVAFYNAQTSSSDSGNASMAYTSSTYNNLYYNDTPYNIASYNMTENTLPYLGTFDSVNSALDYFISNGVTYPNEDLTQGYTNLDAGNVIYFDIGNNTSYDIQFTSNFFSYSGLFTKSWTNDNRKYGFSDTLPNVGNNFSETSGTAITWQPNGATTITGQSKTGDAEISGTTTGRYLWVLNPFYNYGYYDDALNADALNGRVSVYGVPSGTPVYTYKLSQNATSIGLESVMTDTVGGVGEVSSTENEATSFVSQDDNTIPYTQTVGGDTSAPEEVTAQEGIRQTLQQFVDYFTSLFSAPVTYIQTLITSGHAFMQSLSGIFTWLPEPVVSVFLSALVLMIVIGVIKMLL